MRARISVRELGKRLTSTIHRVWHGEILEVTHDGLPIATLSPDSDSRIQRLVARGEAAPPIPLGHPLRRHQVTGELTAGEVIADDRGKR